MPSLEELMNAGDQCANSGDLLGALANYTEAIKLDPDPSSCFWAHYEMGKVLSALERYDEAAKAYYETGKALSALDLNSEPVKAFTEVIKLDPSSFQAYYYIGEALSALERYDEAVEAFIVAIKLDPSCFLVYYKMGEALLASNRNSEAVEAFTEVIKLDPSCYSAHYKMGEALSASERYDEAVKAFAEATKLDPKYSWAHYKMGETLLELGRNSEAADAFMAAIEPDLDLGMHVETYRSIVDKLYELGAGKRVADFLQRGTRYFLHPCNDSSNDPEGRYSSHYYSTQSQFTDENNDGCEDEQVNDVLAADHTPYDS